MRALTALLVCLWGMPAAAYDWAYQNPSRDVPLSVVLGTASDATAWVSDNRSALTARFAAVPSMAPGSVFDGAWQPWPNAGVGAQLLQVIGRWPAGHPLAAVSAGYVGAYVAKPAVVDPTKPLIIALHGHEISHRGEPPAKLWTERWWPEALVKAGYVVITPSHLLYAQLSGLYAAHDHHAVWTRFVWEMVQGARATPAGFPAFTGYVASGVSSGGQTATFLTGWRPEIGRGVYAGSLIPLEWLRREYRIAGHPDNWNMRDLYSYLPLYLLAAHKPQQWQLGTADGVFPNGTALTPVGTYFAGTKRDVIASEVLGDFLAVRDVAVKLGGSARLHIHGGAHDMDVPAMLAEIQGD